jgi:hypothetical protein
VPSNPPSANFTCTESCCSAWQVNYDLLPFIEEDVKKEVESGNFTKKNKALWDAYVIASQGHDLDWFKEMLASHEQAMQEDALYREAKAEEKARKADKATKRKSTAGDVSDDVDMEDAGDDTAPSAKKAKASKKRKKEDDSDGEPEKVRSPPIEVHMALMRLTACKDPEAKAKAKQQAKGGVSCKT